VEEGSIATTIVHIHITLDRSLLKSRKSANSVEKHLKFSQLTRLITRSFFVTIVATMHTGMHRILEPAQYATQPSQHSKVQLANIALLNVHLSV